MKGRKTGLIIPYWEADRFSDDLEQVKEHRNPCFAHASIQAVSGFFIMIVRYYDRPGSTSSSGSLLVF